MKSQGDMNRSKSIPKNVLKECESQRQEDLTTSLCPIDLTASPPDPVSNTIELKATVLIE